MSIASDARASSVVRGRSVEGASTYDLLRRMPREMRWEVLKGLGSDERAQVFAASMRDAASPYALWQDDPVAFTTMVLRQRPWSAQAEVLDAIPGHRRIAVPSAFGTGKTFGAAEAVLWMGSVFPAGTTTSVTTATRMRQVTRQVWPEIRTLHALAGLPGQLDTTQWKMPTSAGNEAVVAYGFTIPANDESAAQGIHARGGLLLIVDEAGGIGRKVGQSFRALLTGHNTHLLAIGNPPTDDESSWFESLCNTPGVAVVQIPVTRTPNFTGERTPRCRACPPEVPAHRVARHLVDREWERETRRDHGETSAYYISKALAEFPKNATRSTIPASWVENAVERLEATCEGRPVTVRDRNGRPAAGQPRPGAWVRMGVDVAADGGDELAISRVEGDVIRVVHTSAGPQNADSMKVTGVIAEHIREAVALRQRLGTPDGDEYALRVKVDVIGVGWAVVGLLKAWVAEGILPDCVVIVEVDVREGLHESRTKNPEGATLRPARKRDEMWLAGRAAFQPDDPVPVAGFVDGAETPAFMGPPQFVLDVDRTTAAQMSGPDYTTNSRGETVVESKASMKDRGLPSPDRAECCLLGIYEPEPIEPRKRRLILAGV